jgi:enoyl-CoA hydratase
MEEVLFSQEGSLGFITLNRPSALNALTLPMIIAMQDQLHLWKLDSSIHAVVIQAQPGPVFCAGGDVRWLYHSGKANPSEQLKFFWHEYRLNHFIHHLGKPYIAFMDGITLGGGVGISMHGSHPVASERFIFSMPETGIGFFPDVGASYLLTACPEGLGVYLGLTGARLNPWQAKQAGLIHHCVSKDQTSELLARLIQEDLSKDAHAGVESCLQAFAMTMESNSPNFLEAELMQCFTQPSLEEIQQNLKQCKAAKAQAISHLLETKSPLSLKVTLEQLHKAKGKSLADCLKMDYDLVQHFIKDADFYEGVRALLIDKDKTPHWNPSSLEEIPTSRVNNYFKRTSPLQFLP